MATFTATTGTDNPTLSTGADIVNVQATTQIQAADTFQGSDGVDAINVGNGSTGTVSVNLSNAGNDGTSGFLNFEALTFANTGNPNSTVTATFSSAQFGTGKISNSLAVTGTSGNNAVQAIVVNVVSGTSFTAAGWTFSNWSTGNVIDTVTLNGSTGNETIYGSGVADTINGNDGNDVIGSGNGNDVLNGGNGNDHLSGQGGNDTLSGGAGNDSLWAGAGTDTIDGGADTDTLYYSTFTSAVTVTFSTETTGTASDGIKTDSFSNVEAFVLGSGNDTFTGGTGADTVTGGRGVDSISLGGGNDTFIYGASDGNDIVDGGSGTNTVILNNPVYMGISLATFAGWTNFQVIDASPVASGSASLIGTTAGETINLSGYTLTNFAINGMGGNDTITGSSISSDRIIGGTGADVLTGGGGADTFVYLTTSHSLTTSADTITDMSSDDLIDLTAIDANTLVAGDQAFSWIGVDAAFTGAGQLRYNSTLDAVQGDVNGDGRIDIQILLSNAYVPDALDFAL